MATSQLQCAINKISTGQLTVTSENSHGAIAYHGPHKRDEFVYPTRNLEEVSELIGKGWSMKIGNGGYLMRAPETWLVDLTDPSKIRGDLRENLALYVTLKQMICSKELSSCMNYIKSSKFGNKIDAYLLSGEALETEIRIAGSNARIHGFRKELLKEVRKNTMFKPNYEAIVKDVPRTRKLDSGICKFDELSPIAKEFYRKIADIHETIGCLYEPDKILTGIWKDIPSADVYIFIPKSGFRLALGFVNSRQKYDDVMFWEYHAGQTQSPYEGHIMAKPLRNKKVNIIDVVYSGTTINSMDAKVADEQGTPIKIALFPKSQIAIQSSDYYIFLDKIKNLSDTNFSTPYWAEQIYKEIIRA